jgi:hypothetical protein
MACTPMAPADSPAPPPEVQLSAFPPGSRTVLTGEAARNLARQCSRVSPGPIEAQWSPSDAELNGLEFALSRELAAELDRAGASALPNAYFRQYAGFIINGRQLIYVNGVHADAIPREINPQHPFDWRTQAVQICDGGPITFGVEYDPATRQFSNFAFNGSV